ncbi:TRAP transporter small permease subunit [Roseixanthobacter glucoisosaccharinicivorans]|uniref:TRAP transporter small permease subunit n=1 Tax=Roseixanthobacter glucoisosaccharinicivorans TaxID=3119923 RepID=UPI003729908A
MRAASSAIAAVLDTARWLILPLSLLLFLQWPLRELVKAYSREANDIGQWMFALYVAAAVTAATRARAHLASDILAHRFSPRTRAGIARVGVAISLLPWSIWLIVAGYPMVRLSVLGLEAFPETYNPGYFLVKLAMWLLALLAFVQAAIDLFAPGAGETA